METTLELNVNKEDEITLKITTKNGVEKKTFKNYRDLKAMVFDKDFKKKYDIEKGYLTKFKKNINDCFQTQNITLFGGPGTGKSTTATETFSKLKKESLDVEYIPEYAKDLTYGINSIENPNLSRDSLKKIQDQNHITNTQISRVEIIKGSNDVDVSIQDSPFILGLAYINYEDPHFDPETYKKEVVRKYLSYNNLNIYLRRPKEANYQESGRSQTKEEAQTMDTIIEEVLQETNQRYIELDAYTATTFLVEFGKTMDNLTNKDLMKIFSFNKDKKLKQQTYHQLIVEKTIDRIIKEESLEEKYMKMFNIDEKTALEQIKFVYEEKKEKYISKNKKLEVLKNILKTLDKKTRKETVPYSEIKLG